MLGSLIDVSHIGYPVLFLLVMAESGGVPVPGETALITAAVLASQGKLQIEIVILIAAAPATISAIRSAAREDAGCSSVRATCIASACRC